jgi:hypothetical protein
MRFDEGSLLAPERRALYSESLRPPAGHVFDAGLATTYSLHLETLLTIPVHLALYAAPDMREALANPLAILEAIERTSRKLAVFVEGGGVHAEERQPRLCALLEPIVVEVQAPRGGAFHPKLWLIRFRPDGKEEEGAPPWLRLLVLSRNLTNDRCWDIAARFDGRPGRRNVAANRALSDLIAALPDLATAPASVGAPVRRLAQALAEEALRTRWDLPEGFDELAFETVGLGRRKLVLPESHRLAVVSPFCDDATLKALAESSRDPALLLSRPETLEALAPATLDRFRRVCVLQEEAETEDGEAGDERSAPLCGLHAKIYLLDQGWDTTLVIGSGNATAPVFGKASNVELLALLTGRRSRLGTVETLMGPDGFGALLTDFVPPAEPAPQPSAAEIEAEQSLDAARDALIRAGLTLTCTEGTPPGDGGAILNQGGSWRMALAAPGAVPLSGIRRLSVWPVTSRREQARDGMALATGTAIDLGAHALADVCGFLAFDLDAEAADRSVAFALNVPVRGLPAGRDRAILRSVIENADGFLRYLRLLLADLGIGPALGAWTEGPNGAGWRTGAAGEPGLLEDLIRAVSRDPERARAVDRLVRRLDGGNDAVPVVPPEFAALWAAFRELVPEEKVS